MLIAGVVHAEEEAWHQGEHDDDHRALGVDAVVDMDGSGAAGGGAGGIEEGLHAFVDGAEGVELAARLEIGPYAVEVIS